MKKTFTAIVLLSLVLISCNQEIEVSTTDQISALVKSTLSSSKFQNLSISLSELNNNGAQYISTDKNSIAIPFVGYADKKALIALFNEDKTLRTVATYEAITDVPADQIYEELKSGKFDGAFEFKMEIGEIRIEVLKSKIMSNIGADNGRLAACRGWSEPGGPLDCAGARIENMNWFDATICYATFGYCLAQNAISCWIDGCAVK